MNNWMNNPFAYLMFLALFRNGGFGFGDGNGAGIATQGIETQAQLNAIRTQLQDNQKCRLHLSLLSRVMALLLASWHRLLTLTSTLFKSAAAMFRLLSSKLPAKLASLLSVLSTQLTSVTATSSRLCRIAAARLSARLQISALICYFRTVKTHLRFVMASVILAFAITQGFLSYCFPSSAG